MSGGWPDWVGAIQILAGWWGISLGQPAVADSSSATALISVVKFEKQPVCSQGCQLYKSWQPYNTSALPPAIQ